MQKGKEVAAKGEHEDRTRVVCHLPLNNASEEKALKEIIAYLKKQKRKRIGVEGFTYSDPSAFFGHWWSLAGKGWISDKMVLLIADFQISLADQHASLSERITELKNVIHQSYETFGSPQEEVWIVSFRITRFT